MRYAVIENNKVINVVEAEPNFAETRGWIQTDIAGPGWTYDENADPPFYLEEESVPTPIPSPITARQFLIQLAVTGIITPTEALAAAQNGTVPAAIDAVFETLPSADALGARITWARMTEVPRNDPLFLVAGPVLGLTSEDIDQFFRDAAAIP